MIEPPSVRTLENEPIDVVYEEGIHKIEKIRAYFRETHDKALELMPDFESNFNYCQYPFWNADLVLNHLIWLLREMEYRVKVRSANIFKQGELF